MRNDTRGTVNLRRLKEVLLSSPNEAAEYKARFLDDKVLRFLDMEDISGDRVVY